MSCPSSSSANTSPKLQSKFPLGKNRSVEKEVQPLSSPRLPPRVGETTEVSSPFNTSGESEFPKPSEIKKRRAEGLRSLSENRPSANPPGPAPVLDRPAEAVKHSPMLRKTADNKEAPASSVRHSPGLQKSAERKEVVKGPAWRSPGPQRGTQTRHSPRLSPELQKAAEKKEPTSAPVRSYPGAQTPVERKHPVQNETVTAPTPPVSSTSTTRPRVVKPPAPAKPSRIKDLMNKFETKPGVGRETAGDSDAVVMASAVSQTVVSDHKDAKTNLKRKYERADSEEKANLRQVNIAKSSSPAPEEKPNLPPKPGGFAASPKRWHQRSVEPPRAQAQESPSLPVRSNVVSGEPRVSPPSPTPVLPSRLKEQRQSPKGQSETSSPTFPKRSTRNVKEAVQLFGKEKGSLSKPPLSRGAMNGAEESSHSERRPITKPPNKNEPFQREERPQLQGKKESSMEDKFTLPPKPQVKEPPPPPMAETIEPDKEEKPHMPKPFVYKYVYMSGECVFVGW